MHNTTEFNSAALGTPLSLILQREHNTADFNAAVSRTTAEFRSRTTNSKSRNRQIQLLVRWIIWKHWHIDSMCITIWNSYFDEWNRKAISWNVFDTSAMTVDYLCRFWKHIVKIICTYCMYVHEQSAQTVRIRNQMFKTCARLYLRCILNNFDYPENK